jgi:hypothetical protein
MRPRNHAWHRRHEPETEEATITDQQWAFHWCAKGYLDVPKELLLEPSTLRERFDAGACSVERLSLEANALDRGVHSSVTERLDHRSACARRLYHTFHGGLRFCRSARRLDAATLRLLRQGRWRHGPEDTGADFDTEVVEHAVVAGRRQQHFSEVRGPWVVQLCPGERPPDVIAAERTRRGDLDEKTPNPAIGVVHANRRNGHDANAAPRRRGLRSFGLATHEVSVDGVDAARHGIAEPRSSGVARGDYQQ